jgi:dienelactone hydrolase
VRRSGEQSFFFRGVPEIGPQGERFFGRQEKWVNFVLGTDQRGFFLGTINGNGIMPFPHVTLEELGIDAWHQLVVVKDAAGFQKFYHNGLLVHTDTNAISSGKVWPFRNTTTNAEPIRLAVPLGGLIGEAWIFGRELSAEEVQRDFRTKAGRYKPALTPSQVLLREMNLHPGAHLWPEAITKANWFDQRKRIRNAVMKILGPFPKEKVPLEPRTLGEEDLGHYIRRKVSIQVQANDRMPAYMLIPKSRSGRRPAILCFYGTTSGAGKNTTVGLSGRSPGSSPHPNLSFAIDMVEAGFVGFAADYLRDGERVALGRKPYDTTEFYEQFPDWSVHGKDAWDTSRAIDYLETLDFVDAQKIGMVGHSYGGHSTIFCAALEPRVKVAVANGPVSDFLHHGLHWGVPKGGGNSQSMPALRQYVLDHTLPLPVTFYEFTSLIAPRPLLVSQAVGERRPMEEENYAALKHVYDALGHPTGVKYQWYAGDHDFPPEARRAAVEWFKRWFGE